MDTFGSWLRDQIASQPSTLHQFAKAVGVSRETVSHWCSGTIAIRDFNLTRIANALGISREIVRQKFKASRLSNAA